LNTSEELKKLTGNALVNKKQTNMNTYEPTSKSCEIIVSKILKQSEQTVLRTTKPTQNTSCKANKPDNTTYKFNDCSWLPNM